MKTETDTAPPAPPTYEISSFQDILDKVPFDRIAVLMAELGEVLGMMAAANEMVRITAAEAGTELPAELSTIKLPMSWTDDHKETHTVTGLVKETGEKFMEMKLSPAPATA